MNNDRKLRLFFLVQRIEARTGHPLYRFSAVRPVVLVGADALIGPKAPLPRGGSLRSAQTGRVFEPILFFLFQKEKNGFNLPRKERGLCKTGSANRAAIASEEASSIPFPPGRRKLHIRSLLLPSQIVTVSLGHNLAIWNFTTPHAVLMMADRQHFADTVCMGTDPGKSILDSSDFLIRAGGCQILQILL